MLTLLFLAGALAQPPQVTLDQLGEAMARLDDPTQVESIRVVVEVVHSKPDGEERQVERITSLVRLTAEGKEVTRLEHTRDGEQVPEEDAEDGDKDADDDDVLLPGEASSRYSFGPTRAEGGVSQVSFEPARGESSKDLATGELAWDSATGRPLWIEFVPVRLPWMVQSLVNRLELSSTEPLHPSLIHSEGKGGVPGIRRIFAMDMRIEAVDWAR